MAIMCRDSTSLGPSTTPTPGRHRGLVAHRYDPAHTLAGDSETGVVEAAVVAACGAFDYIANTCLHRHKTINALPDSRATPPCCSPARPMVRRTSPTAGSGPSDAPCRRA